MVETKVQLYMAVAYFYEALLWPALSMPTFCYHLDRVIVKRKVR